MKKKSYCINLSAEMMEKYKEILLRQGIKVSPRIEILIKEDMQRLLKK